MNLKLFQVVFILLFTENINSDTLSRSCPSDHACDGYWVSNQCGIDACSTNSPCKTLDKALSLAINNSKSNNLIGICNLNVVIEWNKTFSINSVDFISDKGNNCKQCQCNSTARLNEKSPMKLLLRNPTISLTQNVKIDRSCFKNINLNIFQTISYNSTISKLTMLGSQLKLGSPYAIIEIADSIFENTTEGAIHIINSGNVSIENCNFTANVQNDGKSLGGGAIYVQQSDVSIINSNFDNNSAHRAGGTIYLRSGHLKFTGTTIHGPLIPSVVGDVLYCVFDENTDILLENTTIDVSSNIRQNNHVIYCITIANEDDEKDIQFIENVKISCPPNDDITTTIQKSSNVEKTLRTLIVSCNECPKDSYSLHNSSASWLKSNSSDFNYTYRPRCLHCPRGGVCDNGIKSKNNHWGFLNYQNSSNINFILCPSYYCCSSNRESKCETIHTCDLHRTGIICGNCTTDYTLDFFGHKCISNEECHPIKSTLFWVFFVLAAFTFLLVIMYLKEFLIGFLSSIIHSKKNNSKRTTDHENPNRDSIVRANNGDDNDTSELQQPENTPLMVDYGTTKNDRDKDDEEGKKESRYAAGLIKISFFFYQAALIIRINSSAKSVLFKDKKHNILILGDIITSIFNMKFDLPLVESWYTLCIKENLNAVDKEFIKVSFIVIVFAFIVLFSIIEKVRKRTQIGMTNRNVSKRTGGRQSSLHVFDDDNEVTHPNTNLVVSDSTSQCVQINNNASEFKNLPFQVRLMGSFLQITLLGFSLISVTALTLVHCVDVGKYHTYVLYIEGWRNCNDSWLNLIWVFIAFWVFPFSFCLYLGTHLLQKHKILPDQFLKIIVFPPMALWYSWRCYGNTMQHALMTEYDVKVSKYLLMILNEPFRRNKKGKKINWEPVFLLRRICLVIPSIFIQSPVAKVYPLGVLLILYTLHHIIIQPFKQKILNRIELASLGTLSVLILINTFWAYTMEYINMGVNNEWLINFGWAMMILEMCLLAIPFFMLVIASVYYVRVCRFCRKSKYALKVSSGIL